MSLAEIGLLTAILGDTAEIFGCVLEVPDIVTAITFVALGTSMPDLFASLSAAKADPTADASIVNVTGSNAVNVFLGLGIPFMIGSVYWQAIGRTDAWVARHPEVASQIDGVVFVADSTHFGFGVMCFCFGSVIVLILLYLRRRVLGGELGGDLRSKVATFVCCIGMFIGFSSAVSWRTLRFEHYWDNEHQFYTVEAMVVFWGNLFAQWSTLVATMAVLFLHWRKVGRCSMEVQCDPAEAISSVDFASMDSVTTEQESDDPTNMHVDMNGSKDELGQSDIVTQTEVLVTENIAASVTETAAEIPVHEIREIGTWGGVRICL